VSKSVENQAKTCSGCGLNKPLSEYYRHADCKDGHVATCKTCCSKKQHRYLARPEIKQRKAASDKTYRIEHRERRRIIVNRWNKTLKGRASGKASADKRTPLNRYKAQAYSKVKRALKSGKLIKMPCMICGSTNRIHGHHDSYDKPLDVTWLCPLHHVERHRGLVQEE